MGNNGKLFDLTTDFPGKNIYMVLQRHKKTVNHTCEFNKDYTMLTDVEDHPNKNIVEEQKVISENKMKSS